jgi:hypothetical protein
MKNGRGQCPRPFFALRLGQEAAGESLGAASLGAASLGAASLGAPSLGAASLAGGATVAPPPPGDDDAPGLLHAAIAPTRARASRILLIMDISSD